MRNKIEILEMRAEEIKKELDYVKESELSELEKELIYIQDKLIYLKRQQLQIEASYEDYLDYLDDPNA